VTLLDTRNDYEVKLGTFRNAPCAIGIEDIPRLSRCRGENFRPS
jgi:predicted sulfurtransferase